MEPTGANPTAAAALRRLRAEVAATAALIMISVFAGSVLVEDPIIKSIGVLHHRRGASSARPSVTAAA